MRSLYEPRFKLSPEAKQRILQDVVEYEQKFHRRRQRKDKNNKFFHLGFQGLILATVISLFIQTPLFDTMFSEKDGAQTETQLTTINDSIALLNYVPKIVPKNVVYLNDVDGSNSYHVKAVGGSLLKDSNQGVVSITVVKGGTSLTDYYVTTKKHGAITVINQNNQSILMVTGDGTKWTVDFSGNSEEIQFNFKRVGGDNDIGPKSRKVLFW
ncbi:hypothetical protein [Pseudoneobacillus sp. C159]